MQIVRRFSSRGIFALIAITAGAPVAQASSNWQANPSTPDDWFDYFSWSAGIPTSSSNAAYIGNGGTAMISYGDASAEGVYLGYGGGGNNNNSSSGSVVMTGGQLYCSNYYIYLGYASGSTGAFNQSGGQVNTEYLDIASNSSNVSGIYQLSGTGQLAAQYENIGYASTSIPTSIGQFTQTGGSNTVSSQLNISNGTYVMSGNSFLSAYQLAMAASSTNSATFIQAGGAVALGGSPSYIGSSGNASYSMTAGAALSSSNTTLYVGYSSGSSGTLNITDSTVNLGTGNLYLGSNSNANGAVTMNGNSQLYSGSQYIGNSTRASFIQNSGTNNIGTATLYIANGNASAASYTLAGSSILLTGNQYIGGSSSTDTATFTQSGGTNNLGNYNLYVGNSASASYSLLNAGMLLAANEYISSNLIAVFSQSGGTNILSSAASSSNGVLDVGIYNGNGGNGQFLLSGGLLSTVSENIGSNTIGASFNALFNQTGGTNINANFTINSSGRYNLLTGAFQATKSFANAGTFDLQNPAAVGLTGINSLTLAPLAITGTGNLIVEQNAALYAGSIKQSALTIGGKIQIAAGSATSVINSLNITTGSLDITNNQLILDYPSTGASPLSAVRGYLHAGYTSNQTGPGIISSTAAGNAVVSIGYGEASSLNITTFGTVSVDTTAILIRYTWVGDANLDGVVDGNDLALIQSNGSTWTTGDFNYDGQVNSDDYSLFALGAAASGGGLIPLPEPITLAGLVIPFLARRRK